MLNPLHVALLWLGTLAVPEATAQETGGASGDDWRTPARHLELRADANETAPEVRISPGAGTVLLFDSPVARVEVDQRDQFRRVMVSEDGVTLVPSDALAEGARLRLTVHFADGAAPARADLWMVVHPALADGVVEVHRRPRSLESYQQEAREAHLEVQRLQGEVKRLQDAREQPPGLTGSIAAGYIGEKGVAFRDVSYEFRNHPKNPLRPRLAWTYRTTGRLAVRVKLESPATSPPWLLEGAALVDTKGTVAPALRVWPPEAIPAGGSALVIVEFQAPETVHPPYTLKLWATGGTRPIILGNVTFREDTTCQ